MNPQPKGKTIDIRREGKQCFRCGQRFSGDAQFCPFDGVKLDSAILHPRGDPLLGSTLDGRYEVLEVLGEGGTGRVYKVRHKTLNRLFAMKLLRRELARDAELARRFIQEAKATARVQHPYVVEITDFGELPNGILYLVTELLVGRTLGEVIRTGGPIELQRAAQIARQIAGALGAAHAAGVVHRDLKPDNVFLLEGRGLRNSLQTSSDPPDNVRIVDFGAAKLVGTNRLTRDGIVFGTPNYMSPEQASGQPIDHRTDIYSLGVIMYEMFTGRVPFEADTYMGVLTQHLFVQPVPPSQAMAVGCELGVLEEITLVCLAKKPEDRYPSMEVFAREVDRAIRTRSLPASARAAPSLGDLPVVGTGWTPASAPGVGDTTAGMSKPDDRPFRSPASWSGSNPLETMILPKRWVFAAPVVCGGVIVALLTVVWTRIWRKDAHPADSSLAAETTDMRDATPPVPAAVLALPSHTSAPVPTPPPASAATSATRLRVVSAHSGDHLPGPPVHPTRDGARHPPPLATSIDDVGDPFSALR